MAAIRVNTRCSRAPPTSGPFVGRVKSGRPTEESAIRRCGRKTRLPGKKHHNRSRGHEGSRPSQTPDELPERSANRPSCPKRMGQPSLGRPASGAPWVREPGIGAPARLRLVNVHLEVRDLCSRSPHRPLTSPPPESRPSPARDTSCRADPK